MVRRAKFANGTPPPKPERSFSDKLKTLKNVSQGISPESRIRLLDYFIQEALQKNQITKEQASGIYNQLQLDKDKIRKQIDDYETGNFNDPFRTEREEFAVGGMPYEIFGKKIDLPFYCSPTALQRIFHYEGERAVAKAAQKFNTMFGVSSLATVSVRVSL